MKLTTKARQDIVEAYRNGINGKSLAVREIAQIFSTSVSTVSLLAKTAGLTRQRYACVVDASCISRPYADRQRIDRVLKSQA